MLLLLDWEWAEGGGERGEGGKEGGGEGRGRSEGSGMVIFVMQVKPSRSLDLYKTRQHEQPGGLQYCSRRVWS